MTDHPSITLAGKHYPVKPLVIRQLRVVVPALMRLKTMNLSAVTQDHMDDLIEITYQAVCPGHEPPLTRDAFMSMPIAMPELLAALPVIAEQSGMLKKDASPGEAPGAESPPTGTRS